MNERVRELLKQAGGEFWQRLENDVVKQDAYITFDPPESLEKFAELIVRECIEQIQVLSKDAQGEWCGEWNESDVLKHFGVEE